MKIFILTNEMSEKNGWGRYSMDLVSALKNHGAEIVLAEGILPNPLTYKVYFLAWWYAWRLVKSTKGCDVIHSFIEPYSYIAYWLSVLTGKKYFITAHGTWSILPYSFSSLKSYFHKKSFENAEKILCVSNYTKQRLLTFGLKNLAVINNGITFEKFYSSETSFNRREDIVVSVGSLNPAKGYQVSLRAFAEAVSEFKDLHYYIVGNQSNVVYFNELKLQAINLGVGDKVKFLQHLSHDELLGLYRKAKVFVLSSLSMRSDFEGFGLVYLEAGACGLPVIGSLDSGAEDAIKDGETGFLVNQNDPGAVAEAIAKIMGDKNLAGRLAAGGVQWAKEHDWSIVVKNYLKTYE